MRYQGGKIKLGPAIIDAIYKHMKEVVKDCEALPFYDIFCGTLGVTIPATKVWKQVIASDAHKDLMMMWRGVKSGDFVPPKMVTKEEWTELKKATTNSALRGFVGFGCAFNGIWFATFANTPDKKTGENRVPRQSANSVIRVKPDLQKMTLKTADYRDYADVKNSIVYMDPPYHYKNKRKIGSTSKMFREFDADDFWKFAREMSKNNYVFVSNVKQNIPDDFKCIWQKEILRTMGLHKKTKRTVKTECLVVHRDGRFYEEFYGSK